MSNRKLQVEIDRVLKKVAEGIVDFEELFEKIYQTTNQSQKEKIEQDLKKEIKKLQRLRDQIKAWISSSEIKDKKALLENRKLIETQMERFKALEREMKTKQYSKEGLQAKEKLDPAEVAKTESANWISSMVERLNTQIDTLEAESEQIHAAKTRKLSKTDSERLKAIDAQVETHKFHMTKLETMLRLLENESLNVDDVDSVKDSVEYYVESNLEPDFMDDNEIYDHLDLFEDETLGTIGLIDEHNVESAEESEDVAPPPPPAKKKLTSKEIEDAARQAAKDAKAAQKSASSNKNAKTPVLAATAQPKTNAAASPAVLPLKTPPQKYATAAAAAVSVTERKTSNESKAPLSTAIEQSARQTPVVSPTEMSFSSVVAASNIKLEPVVVVPVVDTREVPSFAVAPVPLLAAPVIQDLKQIPTPLTASVKKSGNKYPPQFLDLVSTFKSARSKTYGHGAEILTNQHMLQLLDTSLQQCPDIVDIERPEPFTASRPFTTPPYYPQKPFLAFTSSIAFEKFDTDTLFFIFYYQQGSRQQYLAARELKRQSWRFHKKYLTWFQRHEEPKFITDEYEQGTYIYFDYEGAWCQRKKTEFTFEYRYLEDDG